MRLRHTLIEIRKKNNLKADEVAEELGVSEDTYRKYERSDRLPSVDALVKLHLVLKCTPEDVFEALEYHSHMQKQKILRRTGRKHLKNDRTSNVEILIKLHKNLKCSPREIIEALESSTYRNY